MLRCQTVVVDELITAEVGDTPQRDQRLLCRNQSMLVTISPFSASITRKPPQIAKQLPPGIFDALKRCATETTLSGTTSRIHQYLTTTRAHSKASFARVTLPPQPTHCVIQYLVLNATLARTVKSQRMPSDKATLFSRFL